MRRLLSPLALALALSSPTFAIPQPLGEGKQPQLTASPSGALYAAFGRGTNILVARSHDGGKSFDCPSIAATVAGMPLGMRRGPRIAAMADSVVLTAIESPQGGGKDGDVVAWLSVDAGKTWKKSDKPLNSVPAAAREGLHAMASDGKGRVAVVWLDLRSVGKPGRGTEIWIAISEDGGRTWGPDHVVYANESGSVCECCHPSITFDGAGNPVVMFRNSVEGARDMYVTSSADGGKSFSPATKLGEGTWKINACPMDGGSLAMSDSKVTTVWRRDREVYLAQPNQAEKKLGQGAQPVVALGRGGAYVLWQRVNDLVLLSPGNEKPILLVERAAYPSLAVTADGSVVAAWQSGDSIVTQVLEPK